MGSDENCKYLPMLSLSYVKVFFPLVSDRIKLQHVVNLALVLYSSLMPVIIIVLCLVVLLAL